MSEQTPIEKIFNLKKWILFASTLVGIISTLLIVTITTMIISTLPKDKNDKSDHSTKTIVIISIGIPSILIHFLGMVASLKEHCGMVKIYSFLCLILGEANIASTIAGHTACVVMVVLYIIIASVAYYFRKAILGRKAQSQNTYVAPHQVNPNISNGVQGQLYPTQQFNVPTQQFPPVAGHSQTSVLDQRNQMAPDHTYLAANSIYSNGPASYQPFQQSALGPSQSQSTAEPIYSNTPDNNQHYIPVQHQYAVNKLGNQFTHTIPEEQPSSLGNPPPYVE